MSMFYNNMTNEERKKFLKNKKVSYRFRGFTIEDNVINMEFSIENENGIAWAYHTIGYDEFEIRPSYSDIINKEEYTPEDDEIDMLEGELREYIENDENYKKFYKEHAGDLYSEKYEDCGFEGVPLFYFGGNLYQVRDEKIKLIEEDW